MNFGWKHSRSTAIANVIALLLLVNGSQGCDRPVRSTDVYVDDLPRLVAEPDRRIGSVDDPSVGFSLVASVDTDTEGNTYVLEATVPEIRVYNPEGLLVQRIGRRGSGPGEFQGAARFGVVGDTVWVVDLQLRRLSLFDRSGSLLSTAQITPVTIPLPSGYGYLFPWFMRSDGAFTSHFAMVGSGRDDPPTGVDATDRIPVPFVLYNSEGAVTDTIGWADRPPPRMWRPPSQEEPPYQFSNIGEGRFMVPNPPSRLPWWRPLTDGYIVLDVPLAESQDGSFRVTRIGLAGDTVYTRLLHYRPVPYAAADLDSIAARAARGGPGGGVPYSPTAQSVRDDWERIARGLRGAMNFPEFQPPIEYPWTARDGTVWIRRADGSSQSAQWIILDPNGAPRGQLALSSDVRVLWSGGGVFWAVEHDDLDVPWLVRYTIRPE